MTEFYVEKQILGLKPTSFVTGRCALFEYYPYFLNTLHVNCSPQAQQMFDRHQCLLRASANNYQLCFQELTQQPSPNSK